MNRRYPRYPDDADYQTNAQSYYDDLARKQKLIEMLSKKIWEYDDRLNERLDDLQDVLNSYLDQWDERIENLDDEVSHIFVTWLNDGTLEQIINHDVLGNKADKDYVDSLNESVTTQLTQINHNIDSKGVNIKKYGVIGNGVSDDTSALQDAFDNENFLFFPSGKYKFTHLEITKNDTTVFFAPDVELLASNNTENFSSVLIQGEETDIIFHPSNDIEENSDTLNVTVYEKSLFEEDAFYYIQQNSSTFPNDERWLHAVVKVEEIGIDKIKFDRKVPHFYNSNRDYTIQKVVPIENIRIIGNNTIFNQMGSMGDGSAIHFNYASNIEVSGISSVNGSNRAIYLQRVRDFNIDNFNHNTPLKTDAGFGYGITIENGSSSGLIANSLMKDSRHAVDIGSGSYNILVKNIRGFNANINGHGQNTKYIDVIDCVVEDSDYSVGVYEYGGDSHWRFINCIGLGSTSFSLHNQSHDISIMNCRTDGAFQFAIIQDVKKVTVKNCSSVDSYVPIQITRASDIEVINFSSHDNKRNVREPSRSGIQITNSERVNIGSVFIKGYLFKGIRVNNSNDVSINNSDVVLLDTISTSRGIEIAGTSENVTVTNSKSSYFIVSLSTTKDVRVINNQTTLVSVVSQSPIVVVGNYGKNFNLDKTPENNDVDIIVKNNYKY